MKRFAFTPVLAAFLAAAAGPAALAEEAAADALDPNVLRVCASTKDAPYSERNGQGFENKIAAVLAEEAGMTLDLVMIDKHAIYLARDGIDKDLCDVLIGVDAEDPRLLTTDPYYKSSYAFVSRVDRNFEGEKWEDVDQEGYATFAYRLHSPAETILKYTGRYEYNMIYQASLTNFEDRRNQYSQVPAPLVVSEVAAGNADLGIIFGPEAARYVRDSRTPLKLTPIVNDLVRVDGLVIPLSYAQSVGVSKARPELLPRLEAALVSGKARIEAILKEEGVPTLPLS